MQTWQVVLLGLIEGLTEFIPVSSTGHLVVFGKLIGFQSPGKVFEILIQLGAILAILTVYFARLWQLAFDLPSSVEARRFVLSVGLAFLPAAVIGALFHRHIKALLDQPLLVCVTLIVGGLILLAVDRMALKPDIEDATALTPGLAFKIGLCQCLAMVPGVSRSGATIVGAMLLGVEKRAAAEFSFFLALPTMAGAFAFDLYKNYASLDHDHALAIALGFATAFVSGVLVVRYLLDFVSRHGFSPFAWWRIVLGSVGLGALLVFG